MSVVLFALSSIAAENQVVTTLPGGGAKDILEAPLKNNSPNKTVSGSTDGAIKVKTNCTLPDGRVVPKGQPDYERCLKEKLEKPTK